MPRLENAASQVVERFLTYFAASDWNAMAELLADDICTDDRRRVVNAGIRHGRDAEIADMRAIADVGVANVTLTVMATRGEHLTLCRFILPVEDQGSESFRNEALGIVEINADNRISARLLFDLDDFDAAFAELDARYLAGEAAAYAHAWSVVADTYAAVNRRELPATTQDHVYIDHRPLVSIEGVDVATSLGALWDITPAFSVYAEAVHRLDELGVVVTQVVKATSHEGLDAELRMIAMAISRRRTLTAAANTSTRQTSTPHSPGSTNCTHRRGDWKTPRPDCTTDPTPTSRLATGTPWRS